MKPLPTTTIPWAPPLALFDTEHTDGWLYQSGTGTSDKSLDLSALQIGSGCSPSNSAYRMKPLLTTTILWGNHTAKNMIQNSHTYSDTDTKDHIRYVFPAAVILPRWRISTGAFFTALPPDLKEPPPIESDFQPNRLRKYLRTTRGTALSDRLAEALDRHHDNDLVARQERAHRSAIQDNIHYHDTAITELEIQLDMGQLSQNTPPLTLNAAVSAFWEQIHHTSLHHPSKNP